MKYLTQLEEYMLACYRYIEMNRVKADMVKYPRDYPLSSYRVNAEGKRSPRRSDERQRYPTHEVHMTCLLLALIKN